MGDYVCPHCGMAGQLDPLHAQLPHWPVLCHNCYRFGESIDATNPPSEIRDIEDGATATLTCQVCQLTLSLPPQARHRIAHHHSPLYCPQCRSHLPLDDWHLPPILLADKDEPAVTIIIVLLIILFLLICAIFLLTYTAQGHLIRQEFQDFIRPYLAEIHMIAERIWIVMQESWAGHLR